MVVVVGDGGWGVDKKRAGQFLYLYMTDHIYIYKYIYIRYINTSVSGLKDISYIIYIIYLYIHNI